MQKFYCYEIPIDALRLRVEQGVFFRSSGGETHVLECPTSELLAHALRHYDVYKFRMLAVDGVVWEVELPADSQWIHIGYFVDTGEYLQLEGDEE